jgi:hypothetical protein
VRVGFLTSLPYIRSRKSFGQKRDMKIVFQYLSNALYPTWFRDRTPAKPLYDPSQLLFFPPSLLGFLTTSSVCDNLFFASGFYMYLAICFTIYSHSFVARGDVEMRLRETGTSSHNNSSIMLLLQQLELPYVYSIILLRKPSRDKNPIFLILLQNIPPCKGSFRDGGWVKQRYRRYRG